MILFKSLNMNILQKSKIGWIALGTGSSVWLLRLTYKPLASSSGRLGLKSIDKHMVIETQHTGSISDILLVTAAKMVVTSGEDSKIKFWDFQAGNNYEKTPEKWIYRGKQEVSWGMDVIQSTVWG